MKEKDIIITAFSCGGKMKCSKEAQAFQDPPIVLNVPGGSVDGFKETAKNYKTDCSILDGLISSKLKKILPKRICLVSFSDGWSWISEILKSEKDVKKIDTIILLDGIYTSSFKHWVDFAQYTAKKGDSRFWMAHTARKPSKGTSPKTTNANLFNKASAVKSTKNIIIPKFITDAKLDKTPTSIYSKDETPKHKLYHKDTLKNVYVHGNLVRLEYNGNKLQDQIYLQQYVQPRLWHWLKQEWEI